MFYVKVENNVKIAVYDLNPDACKTVLMIHGWPLSNKIFEYQKRFLVECGYRVITLDLRGFGNSDAPAWGYDYDTLARDIYKVVCKLNLRYFTLIGFSMGGAIVLRYMSNYDGYGVEKLILLGAAAPSFTSFEGFPYGVSRDSVDELIRLAKTDRAKFSKNFSEKLFYRPHSEEIKNWFYDISLSASGIGTVETGYSLRDERGMEDLCSIRIPTGIFHGKKDDIVPYELGVIQQEYIRGSKLFTFENSGHGIFYDELKKFNQQLLNYLRS